jgi:adenosylcobinamide-GDP ribazoletransferase
MSLYGRFQLALGFLTVLPVHLAGPLQPGDLGRAAFFFPWIGLLLGAALAGAHALLGRSFPPLLAAVLVVALWAFLTGGLHLDGLADCCDGLLVSASRERRLEILRDPRLGTFGGTGLALHLILKTAAVAALSAPWALPALLLAPALARWLILPVARQPMARPGGLGADFALGLGRSSFFAALLLPLALAALGGWRGGLAIALAALAVLAAVRLARLRLGGVTGDVLGLTVELSELAVLIAFSVRLP